MEANENAVKSYHENNTVLLFCQLLRINAIWFFREHSAAWIFYVTIRDKTTFLKRYEICILLTKDIPKQ